VVTSHLFTFTTLSNHLISIATAWVLFFFFFFSFALFEQATHGDVSYGNTQHGRKGGTSGQNGMDRGKREGDI
jgi:hypothetical protein